ncbi:MAG: hypothetical protein QOE70_4026 [Chthoniobacter sp.]|jgi:hypothetical protein|nr:hypothetical protein [Chthoniobacter sp.]
MKNRSTIVALSALIAKADLVLFRYPEDEDESHTGRNLAIAGGVGVGGAGLLADRAVMGRYGKRGLIGSGEIKPGSPRSILGRTAADGVTTGGTVAVGRKAAYAQAGRDVRQTVTGAGRSANLAGRMAYGTMRSGGEGVLKSGVMAARKAIKVGTSKLRRFSVSDRLIALSARCDEAIMFDEKKGYQLTPGDHYLRHVGGPIGVAATSRKGKKWDAFKESGGDAVKNIAGGTLGGAAVGGGIGASVGAIRRMRGNGHGAGRGAVGGALIGGVLGHLGGSIRATHGKRQREIQAKYHA